MASPLDALAAQRYDDRIRQQRQSDTDSLFGSMSDSSNPMMAMNAGRASIAQPFLQVQQEAATGPTGFNRSLAPLIDESLDETHLPKVANMNGPVQGLRKVQPAQAAPPLTIWGLS